MWKCSVPHVTLRHVYSIQLKSHIASPAGDRPKKAVIVTASRRGEVEVAVPVATTPGWRTRGASEAMARAGCYGAKTNFAMFSDSLEITTRQSALVVALLRDRVVLRQHWRGFVCYISLNTKLKTCTINATRDLHHDKHNMTTKIAPWLEGLSEAWEPQPPPPKPPTDLNISSASHDASSLRSSRSRIPRRSLSGLPSSLPRPTGSQTSTQKKRNPLAQISSNDTNTFQRRNGTTKLAGSRSLSGASDASMPQSGTVQQRSKSASPSKKQETLEWKRRLVRGELGYGDQTDLFGPSGLENIFAKTKDVENEAPKSRSRMGWLQKSDGQMPSSPPPWPSSFADQLHSDNQDRNNVLDAVPEDEHQETGSVHGQEESFSSNPFDLEFSQASQLEPSTLAISTSQPLASPDKAFIELTQDEGPNDRTFSGQTELEQEDFSPVFVSKHHTVTGQVDYAAVDSHLIKKFPTMKVDLRHPSQESFRRSKSQSDSELKEAPEQSTFSDDAESQSLPAVNELSFSENLPTGSPFPGLGRHVELRRGGYSQYGSFKRRPLSPSQSAAENGDFAVRSDLLSLIPFDASQLPPAPTPPRTPDASVPLEEPKSRSSGSPLKLFGTHDTFTNNRLLRRLSQLNPDGTVRESPARRSDQQDDREISLNSFGSGELNDHVFDAEITITSASDSEMDDSDRSPGSEIPPPGSKIPLAFKFDPTPEITDTYKLNRRLSKHSTTTSKGSAQEVPSSAKAKLQPTVEDVPESHLQAQSGTVQTKVYQEGKRPPTSPFKDPTPKRRRTLHASEFEDASNINFSYHAQLQEVLSSRKRKDARHGEHQIVADPSVMAQRKILRPRNPTPSQRNSREQIEAELREAAEEFAEQEPEKLEAVMEQIESSMASDAGPTLEQQAHALASEVAAFTLKVHKPSGEQGERKRSVTTQDFLDEAMMVMNLIRAKARPQSNLGSVEESEGGEGSRLASREDASKQEESLLRVSRPPSREGSRWRPRAPVHTDARVVSHLRKFQEREERENTDFIANSIASLQVDDDERINDQVVVVDEHSNIRITGPPSDKDRDDGQAVNTHSSEGTSTGRTIGTNSTRKSENVGTLAPDAVAHLIGEQVGGMTFDKDKQLWVRASKNPEKSSGSFLELPSNVTSDDDPFCEISDLPVDEQNELRRISSPGKIVEDAGAAARNVSARDQAEVGIAQQPAHDSRTSSNETVMARPATRDSSHIQNHPSSSAPSRYTAFASSQQEKVETRATSWSDEELAKMSAYGRAKRQPLAYAAAQAALQQRSVQTVTEGVSLTEESEHIAAESSTEQDYSQLQGVDKAAAAQLDMSKLRDNTALDLEDSEIEQIPSPKLRQTPARSQLPLSSAYRTTTRQVSLRRKTLTSRFTTEAHEQSELSFVAPLPGDRMMSLSLSVSRPLSKRHDHHVVEVESSPSKQSSSFILSDLPDFTVHEADPEKPSERALATRLAHHAAAEVNDRYALAVKELVKILTDVNEEEPYWEDLRSLNLHARSLASLHGLDDFCTHVQDLDVSSNALTHLHGTPWTVRRLKARSNQLSSLTSWNHLMNLQYLDVSNNQLDNFNGLGSLIHLRELRADDNHISSLNGLFELDGLLKLQLRRNKIARLDFEGSQFHHLTSLDLWDNQIVTVSHLDQLQSLTELVLDGNALQDGPRIDQDMLRLTSLSLRNCHIQGLDVSRFLNLKHLLVNGNCLSNINGISKLKNLLTLSMERQSLHKDVKLSILDQPLEARTVRLSGTSVPSLNFQINFLSIRHLEMASMGLHELPPDFGLRMPNLKTLNLNFNNLKDIRPILNVQNLEQLSVCGNRLHRLRKSVATFAKLAGLRSLDLRDTPLTQGFYASAASTMSRNMSVVRKDFTTDAEENDSPFEPQSSDYEFLSADQQQDRQHLSRLDEDTKLRRRVYEMLLASSCGSLETLDGLRLDRTLMAKKDAIWHRLVELGIVRRSRNSLMGQ